MRRLLFFWSATIKRQTKWPEKHIVAFFDCSNWECREPLGHVKGFGLGPPAYSQHGFNLLFIVCLHKRIHYIYMYTHADGSASIQLVIFIHSICISFQSFSYQYELTPCHLANLLSPCITRPKQQPLLFGLIQSTCQRCWVSLIIPFARFYRT